MTILIGAHLTASLQASSSQVLPLADALPAMSHPKPSQALTSTQKMFLALYAYQKLYQYAEANGILAQYVALKKKQNTLKKMVER